MPGWAGTRRKKTIESEIFRAAAGVVRWRRFCFPAGLPIQQKISAGVPARLAARMSRESAAERLTNPAGFGMLNVVFRSLGGWAGATRSAAPRQRPSARRPARVSRGKLRIISILRSLGDCKTSIAQIALEIKPKDKKSARHRYAGRIFSCCIISRSGSSAASPA